MKKQELYNAEDSNSVKIMYCFHNEVLNSKHINDFNYVWILYHSIITLLNFNID